MADSERRRVSVEDSVKYVEAIEGLIFDPQPYEALDPTRNNLSIYWENFGYPEYGALTLRKIDEPKEDAREYIHNSHFYGISEQPLSLLVTAGKIRKYQVDMQEVRLDDYRLIFKFLHLQLDNDTPEANLFMNSFGIARMNRDVVFANPYTPSFIEQRRLITVSNLLQIYSSKIPPSV